MWGFKKFFRGNDRPAFTTENSRKSLNNVYISLETNTIYAYRQKEVSQMNFDVEKLKEYYEALLKEREQKVAEALATKDERVKARFEEEKARIEEEEVAKIIAEAEEPYTHDIELCEKFLVEPEEIAEEIVEE